MTIHTIDLEFQGSPQAIAAFLVEGPDGLALVECGPESTRDALVAGIEALGFSPSDVGDVLLTHIHLDHAGAAGWWAATHGSRIHVHPRGGRHLIDPSRLLESAAMVYGEAMERLWGGLTPAPHELVMIVEDGGKVATAGLEFVALETPGHARHHHVWALGDVAFAGDVAGVRLPDCPLTLVTSAPPQFDLEAYEDSIDRLIEADFSRLYLTHFGPLDGPADHLRRYRQLVRTAAEFVRDRLAEGKNGEALQIAYEAWNLERAFRLEVPPALWSRCELANPSAMCADGLALYWQREATD